VVKPFGTSELLARIEAVLRRTRTHRAGPESEAPIEAGVLQIIISTRAVTLAGEPLPLTRKEFDLLALLATRKGEVVSRDFIVDQVWQAHWEAPSRTLDTHIAALRGKLGDHIRIETVRGVGYRLAT
jgi:DNA-binding response OmpR family regulator